MSKVNTGYFFEDYHLGQVFDHATPRTVSGGERALYTALYPTRFALYSSDEFARGCGLPESPIEDLAAFHIVFGKTVPDISLNAVANLGYAECKFLRPVYAGDTLSTRSEVIGLKQNSNGKNGVVWVRSTGTNQRGEAVLSYVRWVMVKKRDVGAEAPETVIPMLKPTLTAAELPIPEGLNFSTYDFSQAGEKHRLADYKIGEIIDHIDGVTIEEAEHMIATRLWQNTAKVHFDASQRADGKRLIYGGHVISMARALSFNGLANAQMIVAINAGTHANPCFSGDTVRARSTVLDKAEINGIGAIRLRLQAYTGKAGQSLEKVDGKHPPHLLLDLDFWALMPK
ncbi:MAG TPA: MaoC family dehydratase [Rhodobacteraceae bacterium]|nr:MaoC family dehydratase [Paracoccaceae bacterium]